MKKAVPLIYSLKTLCAFAVVALHSDLYYKSLVIPLLRIAVPVFFIISGYFYNITATPKILKNHKTLFNYKYCLFISSCNYVFYKRSQLYFRYL